MAKTNVCDGCGAVQAEGDVFATLGMVTPRDYCPGCTELAKDYLAKRDDVHDKAQKAWTEGLKKLNTSFKGKLRVFPA